MDQRKDKREAAQRNNGADCDPDPVILEGKEDHTGQPRNDARPPAVEKIPLGTGYTAVQLPTKVEKPQAELLGSKIPDRVRGEEFIVEPDHDPVPSPEDEFYDYTKDVYGDGTEYTD